MSVSRCSLIRTPTVLEEGSTLIQYDLILSPSVKTFLPSFLPSFLFLFFLILLYFREQERESELMPGKGQRDRERVS